MKEIQIADLQEFQDRVAQLRADLEEQREGMRVPALHLLFRGHKCAHWKLETTLDRYSRKAPNLRNYLTEIGELLPEIEKRSDAKFPRPDDFETAIDDACGNLVKPMGLYPLSPYLIHLRHHGYPSPLLDWTRSADVALFFAFQRAADCKNAAVYCYCEIPLRGKHAWSEQANIYVMPGDKDRCHPRHRLQEAEYTICLAMNEQTGEDDFGSHEDVFLRGHEGQDLLRKFLIPTSERAAILRTLESRGRDAHRLFGTDDALIETILTREEIAPAQT